MPVERGNLRLIAVPVAAAQKPLTRPSATLSRLRDVALQHVGPEGEGIIYPFSLREKVPRGADEGSCHGAQDPNQ